MTRREMLKELGLTSKEFKDLMEKLEKFHGSLTKRQQAVMERSLPTATKAARTFGKRVTGKELQKLIATDPTRAPVASGKVAVLAPNP